MTPSEAIARHTTLHGAYATLLGLLASEDPDPAVIDTVTAEIARLGEGLDQVQPTLAELAALCAAVNETARLADAAARAAITRRDALTAEQAQAHRNRGALDAYRGPEATDEARYLDHRS